jgi:hypothetical protein
MIGTSCRISWRCTSSGRDQRRQAEDEQDVEDVAADHVAERDVDLAAPRRCTDTASSGALVPKATTVRPDHQRRDAEGQRQFRSAAHQQFGADDQGDEIVPRHARR